MNGTDLETFQIVNKLLKMASKNISNYKVLKSKSISCNEIDNEG